MGSVVPNGLALTGRDDDSIRHRAGICWLLHLTFSRADMVLPQDVIFRFGPMFKGRKEAFTHIFSVAFRHKTHITDTIRR